jgi:hypothetical protein
MEEVFCKLRYVETRVVDGPSVDLSCRGRGLRRTVFLEGEHSYYEWMSSGEQRTNKFVRKWWLCLSRGCAGDTIIVSLLSLREQGTLGTVGIRTLHRQGVETRD